MSGLEGRARLVLRAYPPGYRAERGEEIIGTLLEASPPGRRWPAAREARSLVAAGLRARAAQNRTQPLAASMRLVIGGYSFGACGLFMARCWLPARERSR